MQCTRFYSDMPHEEFNKRITTSNVRIIEFEGKVFEVPANATDEQIAAALTSHKKSGTFDFQPLPNPWLTLGTWVGIAFGIWSFPGVGLLRVRC